MKRSITTKTCRYPTLHRQIGHCQLGDGLINSDQRENTNKSTFVVDKSYKAKKRINNALVITLFCDNCGKSKCKTGYPQKTLVTSA
jgi:hypothetical protein